MGENKTSEQDKNPVCEYARFMHDLTNTLDDQLDEDPNNTLFAKFARGDIKLDESSIVFQDDRALAFKDIDPQAPNHFVIISKKIPIGQLHHLNDSSQGEELGYLLYVAGVVAQQQHCTEGYRLVINQGLRAQQSINYLHIHMLSGRDFHWPPG
jgi:histidine triad (HIT) family protein